MTKSDKAHTQLNEYDCYLKLESLEMRQCALSATIELVGTSRKIELGPEWASRLVISTGSWKLHLSYLLPRTIFYILHKVAVKIQRRVV